jgi:hypothetical protein
MPRLAFRFEGFLQRQKYWKKSKYSQDAKTAEDEQRQGRKNDANAGSSRTASGHIIRFV